MIEKYFEDYCRGLHRALDGIAYAGLEELVRLLESAYRDERQIFIMGNGGSAASEGKTRVRDHEQGRVASTRFRRPLRLIYY